MLADPNDVEYSMGLLEAVNLQDDRVELEEGFAEEAVEEEADPLSSSGAEDSMAAAVRYLPISGRYRSCPNPWELTLRVDFDRFRPLGRVSGDYFRQSGSTTLYFGSFVVDAPSVQATSSMIRITGIAKLTWATSFPKIWVYIPRHVAGQPPATARVVWTTTTNRRGASYVLPFESPYFRTVVLEQDHEKAVTPFESYNTGSLPSGGPARTMSTTSAYREAGIEMLDSAKRNEVDVPPGKKWSNAELHTAMENHFSLWRNDPQWKVWYIHANAHDKGPGLRGIMFDQKGRQRQGAAGFYQVMGGSSAAKQREQLYVAVHEIGHCFNLFHSFHKSYMTPPQPNRYDALSFMNYPRNYRRGTASGEAAFWSAFPFAFDALELIHLRHGYYNNVVFGGNPFGQGAALDVGQEYADSVHDASGLNLLLASPKRSFRFGEPPVVQIRVQTTNANGREVHTDSQLHPNYGHVQLAIQRPGGSVVPYSPPLQHCADVETVVLDQEDPVAEESAYIGFDGNLGQTFDTPGTYAVRGAYFALDGSVVLSNVLKLNVASPVSSEDEQAGERLLGDEQGMLLYLLGSDGASLSPGREQMDALLDEMSDHPLAMYAKLTKGFNVSREFSTMDSSGRITTRGPDLDEARSLLQDVVTESTPDPATGLDDQSLVMTMRRLTEVQREQDDGTAADTTATAMLELAEERRFPAHVVAGLRADAPAKGRTRQRK